MTGSQHQVWVTSATTNDEAETALLLCYSLRRTYTTRKICIIACSTIDLRLQKVLNYGFDFVFYLDQRQNPTKLPIQDFAKIYCVLALHTFQLGAYIAPTTLALKNCDDLFASRAESFMLPKDCKSLNVFLFKPSISHFEALVTGLNSLVKNGGQFWLGVFLEKWVENQQSNLEYLPEKFYQRLTRNKALLAFENEISLVDLVEFPKTDSAELEHTGGLLGNLVAIYRRKIWEQDVAPKLDATESGAKCDLDIRPTWKNEPIAIVGMSCRFPKSNNLEEFWNSLFNGEDCTGNPPEFRWTREQSSRYRPEARQTNAGFLKVPVDEFDGKFFGLSPKELIFMDPQHRLLHELVWEALEDACVNPHFLRNTSGSVFMGSWINNFKEILMDSGNSEFFRVYMGNSIGAAAARISFLLGITGPSVSTESGCSSATVALHLACKSLQNGETNLALACGVNLLLHPFKGEDLPFAISPDGHSKAFSEDANGFARAEGGGVLVLKRYSDAVKDGDHIWALIRGSAIKQEAASQNLSTPSAQCEALVMDEALKNAGVKPEQVSFVEAHGTGTVVGDPLEIAAIAKVYSTPNRKEPLVIGSVKTNVGHTESCSGITGIMKVVLSMQNEIIPAHRNFTKLNPACDLQAIPAVLPLERLPWKKCANRKRIAGVSSFGITGSYVHVIMEEPPTIVPRKAMAVENMERPLHLLKISAKSPEAMNLLLEKYQDLLQNSGENLANICHSANTGRADFPVRAAVIAKNAEHAGKLIAQQKFFREDEASEDKLGKICFLFTGQGSQYPGMAKKLYETSPVFQMHFDYVTGIVKNEYGLNILETLWPEDNQDIPIGRTLYSQTSIFCVEYALLKLWSSWGVTPDYVLGHSLGEFAAAVCAGILNVEEAVKLVVIRSKLIDALPQGKMLVVRADKQKAKILLKEFSKSDLDKCLDYAAINTKEQTVFAGDSQLVSEFQKFLKPKEVKCVILDASHAFHSRHMNPILADYRNVAKSVLGAKPRKMKKGPKYISGLRGDVFPVSKMDADYWVQHCRQPVNFLEASKIAVKLGCKTFVEVGPQPVLSVFTMVNNESEADLLCLPSLKKTEVEWETLLSTLGRLYVKGLTINWHGLDMFRQRGKVRLPHYPFIGKKFWPETRQVGENLVHPLLGAPIPNASGTKLFQCGVSLRSHPWIRDHRIGKHAIFPGAAYLEMCLAAGFATVQCLQGNFADMALRPLKLENLVIQAPMLVDEATTVKLQTVVEFHAKDDKAKWEHLSVQICKRVEPEMERSGSWMAHALATLSPVLSSTENLANFEVVNITKCIPSEIAEDSPGLEQIYSQLASVGLHFGPSFQSIEQIWQNTHDGILAKVKSPAKDNSGHTEKSHIVHPVILDAMIQAIMMRKFCSSQNPKKLHVPLQIGKFLWFSPKIVSTDQQLYIQVHQSKPEVGTENCTALLLSSTGTVLASMSNVQLVETSSRVVDAVLEQQQNPMPDLWEEQWRQEPGALENSGDLKLLLEAVKNIDPLKLEKFNNRPEILRIIAQLNKLVYYYMLMGLYDCGWRPVFGEDFEENELQKKLKIVPGLAKQFQYFLRVFAEEGILKKTGASLWTVAKVPPEAGEIENRVNGLLFQENLANLFPSYASFQKVGSHLSGIFQGRESSLGVLFPEEQKSGEPSLTQFYSDFGQLTQFGKFSQEISTNLISEYQAKARKAGKSKSVFKILEIGAGLGNFTQPTLESFDAQGLEYEFTYTDISSGFFPGAEKRFESRRDRILFKKLNIEEDPICQGFVPGYYDYVFASDVIHATRNVKEALQNVFTLLKPGGFFDMNELITQCRCITYMFGLLEGFWRFEDRERRPDHCTLSGNGWKQVLEEVGFSVLGLYPCGGNHHGNLKSMKPEVDKICTESKAEKMWIIFHERKNSISGFLRDTIPVMATGRKVLLVEKGSEFMKLEENKIVLRRDNPEDFESLVNLLNSEFNGRVEGVVYCWALSLEESEQNQENILLPFFLLTKSLIGLKQQRSSGEMLLKLIVLTNDAVNCGDNDVRGYHASTLWGYMRSLVNENSEILGKCVDVGRCENKWEIFYELWNPKKQFLVSFSPEGHRLFAKFTPVKPRLKALELPLGTDRYQLVLPETRQFADLRFEPLQQFELQAGQVEIQVKTVALNFRDVFSVLKPTEAFREINSIGLDWAGVVKRVTSGVGKCKVGDRVFGCNMNKAAFQSHLQVEEEHLLAMPEGMTFCEAATLPAVYATSYYCLFNVAKIKEGDTVLIHTASGGVGLSAIEICKSVEAKVIATAGSKRKRNYLRSLGIQNVFNSRDTDYEQEILKLTNGRGVQVVLNSLTSSGFKEATLNVCAKGARFVEMSKISVWAPQEVKALRPDVEYTVVDLPSVEQITVKEIMTNLERLAAANGVGTIPYVRFDGVHVREALHFMQKAKHIGKVVCVMPEVLHENGNMRTSTPLFHDNATYLITGGLGGIGFQVCRWMLENGARFILLAGRKPPGTNIREEMNELNKKYGAQIVAVQLDVSSFDQCRELICHKIPEMGYPDLRGVMHAAGTLSDGVIENQTWDKLSSPFQAKIQGTLNLHNLTKDNPKLEHFVLFSSIAAQFGSPGQSNHAAGNSFEDALAHYRHSIGLPATSVNWGQWGEVGVATEVLLPGIKPFSTRQGLAALEYTLKAQRTQLGVLNVESFLMLSKFFPQISNYLDDRVWQSQTSSSGSGGSLALKSQVFWQKYDSAEESSEKLKILKDALRNILRDILKLDESDNIEDHSNFREMGVDSLMFVEIKNSLQTVFGERIVVNSSMLRDCDNLQVLSENLTKLINGANQEVASLASDVPTLEQVAELLRQDSVLPADIFPGENKIKIKIENVSTVLLFGATGTLGPYVLKELSKSLQIAKIICIIRSKNKLGGLQRLKDVLKKRDLLSQVDLVKVRCISGSISEHQFGIEDNATWQNLCDEVDAIFNCAASVQHVEHYQNSVNSSGNEIRAVNVEGVKQVLKFACQGKKLKHVYHASSLVTSATPDESGNFSETWPKSVEDYVGVTTLVYPNTRFVGEMLMKQAVLERSIPGKVFRFPLIAGDSQTGRFVLEKNHAMLRYFFILKNGMMPGVPFPMTGLPVDICAWASVNLFLNPKVANDVYNVINCNPVADQEFTRVAETLGYKVDIVEISKFTEKVRQSSVTDTQFAIFKEFYKSDEDLLAFLESVHALKHWALQSGSNEEDYYVSKKIRKYLPEFYENVKSPMDYIYQDLVFAKKQGWLS